ncbi:MAG: hypothetical protein C0483_13000 [Pirellula sp.]|nr:hypothetical protein [Pirellula sp.]
MKYLMSIACITVAFVTSARAETPTAKPWPHQQSDLRPDSRVVWGTLDNGLRYAILPTKSAPTRGSLRMLVLAGSGMESDDQQGMAHFLEHMAFNGTKRFPAGETFEYFQRLGMAFGAHTNAVTEMDRTVYQLELPRANEQLTNDGLKLFRDFLDGMLLDEKEIDKERGVVLSEQMARNTASYRATVGTLQAALAGTKLADRLPIGKTETIRHMTRARFVDFYETWYTPGRTVIIAAGDFDVAMVERGIRSQFGDAQARRGEASDPKFGKPTQRAGLTARFNPVPDAATATISISRVQPASDEVENMAQQRRDILDLLVTRMLNKRLEKLTSIPGSPLQRANIGEETLYNTIERSHLSAQCAPQNWPATVGVLEQEMRRALQHGFTDVELEAAKSDLTSLFQAVISQADTQQPDDLADEIVTSLVENNVFSHPSSFEGLVSQFVPTITKGDCERQLKARWSSKDLEVSVSGNVEVPGDAPQQILAAYNVSSWKPVEAPSQQAAAQFAFTDFGPKGEIVSRIVQADLGIVQAEFANHVRVNIKQTEFEKNKVRTLVRFGGGMLELPVDKPGLQYFAGAAFISGGLKGLSLDELNRQIAGKNATVAFEVGDDAFQLGGACLKESLDLQLQLCAAFLTAPGYEAETERQFFDQIEGAYNNREHTLEGAMRFDGNAFLRSDDFRYTLPTKSDLHRLKLADVAAWLARPLAQGYMEVTIVGDVDPEVALTSLAKTLGALPSRDAAKPAFAEARRMQFPTATKAKELHYTADTPRAVSTVCWPVPGAADTSLFRRLAVLRLVLADRMRVKVREELGATYTPSVMYYAADVYPDYGYLGAQLVVDPSKLPEMGPLSKSVAEELALGSITDDEFERAIRPALEDLEAQRRDNSYWLGSICDSQERPTALADIRSKATEYAAIKKSEIEALARKYLSAENATVLNIAPTKAGDTTMAAK